MNKYEIMFIVRPDMEEAEIKKTAESMKKVLTDSKAKVLEEKAFNASMEKIVLDKDNYKTLANLKIGATLIYGELDQFIASYNIPKILNENPDCLKAIKTIGRHGVSRDKYTKIAEVLEEISNA